MTETRGAAVRGVKKTAVALSFLLSVLLAACAAPSLQGDSTLKTLNLQEKPAPDFSLTDQDDGPVSLSDFRGKVVALTFLYTNCTDVCPIIANTFGQAYDKLGSAREKAAFVAVTVDPERDTVQQVNQYLKARGLMGKLVFLTGDREALEKVWADYAIGVERGTPTPGTGGSADSYDIMHTTAVYLIDTQGRERTLIPGYQFTADQLINEMRPLMSGANAS